MCIVTLIAWLLCFMSVSKGFLRLPVPCLVSRRYLNRVIFEQSELQNGLDGQGMTVSLRQDDPRARHITEVHNALKSVYYIPRLP
jgi:hypothetical protein